MIAVLGALAWGGSGVAGLGENQAGSSQTFRSRLRTPPIPFRPFLSPGQTFGKTKADSESFRFATEMDHNGGQ